MQAMHVHGECMRYPHCAWASGTQPAASAAPSAYLLARLLLLVMLQPGLERAVCMAQVGALLQPGDDVAAVALAARDAPAAGQVARAAHSRKPATGAASAACSEHIVQTLLAGMGPLSWQASHPGPSLHVVPKTVHCLAQQVTIALEGMESATFLLFPTLSGFNACHL